MSLLGELLMVRKTLIIIVVPFLALPILFIDGSKEMSCLYCIVVIGTMWIFEALPIPVTALLPAVLFPLLGVNSPKEAANGYVKDTLFFSFACLSFALSIERWNLHRRIALNCLLLTGSSPKWLVLGFMTPTWFLSMWVNNTSATAMMIPVANAVLTQLRELQTHTHELKMLPEASGKETEENSAPRRNVGNGKQDDIDADEHVRSAPVSPEFRRLCKALCLSVCYAATIGGTGSLTGTSTNLVMNGQADEIFADYHLESGVTFMSWMMCCLPLSVTCLLIAWLWLIIHFFSFKELVQCGWGDQAASQATKSIVRKELHKLGPISFAEKAVVVHFLTMISLWLTMKMPGGYGWAKIFPQGYVSNSTSAIIVIASLFIFPSGVKKKTGAPKPLMSWPYVQENFPWGTWILLGGGFAIASACQKSGLSAWFGSHLTSLSGLPLWLTVFLLSVSMSFMTEVTSNTATTTILGPIMAQLAISLQVNPLYLLYATALSCSLAFMLPVATAPNAIVFATGYISIKDMVKAGIVLNFLCVFAISAFLNTWFMFLLNLDILPQEMRFGITSLSNATTESTVTAANFTSTETPRSPFENGTLLFI